MGFRQANLNLVLDLQTHFRVCYIGLFFFLHTIQVEKWASTGSSPRGKITALDCSELNSVILLLLTEVCSLATVAAVGQIALAAIHL